MEAADEIPRQLRLRDLGGVIICDFIDLRYERHRRELEKRLHDNLKDDRAKTKMLRMSQFGIIEMTRQRMRPSLKRSIYFDCPHCKGAGLVKTPESMALDVMRRLAIAANDNRVFRIDLAVCPEVAFYLQNKKRATLAALEQHWRKRIMIKTDPNLGMDAMTLELYDTRDGLVFLEELGMTPTVTAAAPAARPPQRQQGGRGERRDQGRDQRDQRGRGGRRDQQRRDQRPPQSQQQRPQPVMAGPSDGDEREDVFDMDRAEDAVEQREVELLSESEEIAPPPAPLEETSVEEPRPRPVEEPEPEAEPQQWREDEAIASEPPAPRQQPPVQETHRAPQEEQQGRGRRGRGRGSRGHGGNRGEQQRSQAPAPVPSHSEAQQSAPMTTVKEAQNEQKGGPRRRRGSRGRGRGRSVPAVQVAAATAGRAEPAQSAPVVVKTGSTDRHLMSDEPVLPQPVQRPRTYRDLDHIPDDLD